MTVQDLQAMLEGALAELLTHYDAASMAPMIEEATALAEAADAFVSRCVASENKSKAAALRILVPAVFYGITHSACPEEFRAKYAAVATMVAAVYDAKEQ